MKVSIIIPSKNRLYAIKKTIDTYLVQKKIGEIIFVDDGGTDNLEEFLKEKQKNTQVKIKYIKHSNTQGAAASRNSGIKEASCEFILFGEDDVYLSKNYVETIIKKMESGERICSGRLILLLPQEDVEQARERFGLGMTPTKVFDSSSFTVNFDSIFNGDIRLPMTHALFMIRRDEIIKNAFDEYYFPGNGYREETDPQLKIFCEGGSAMITNDTACFHMARAEVKRGGQRTSRIKQYLYCLKYNSHF